MSEVKTYRIEEIMNMLPHRYPFLLVDRLEVEVPGEKGVGIKNVTMNEEFFQGHFPGASVYYIGYSGWAYAEFFCNLFNGGHSRLLYFNFLSLPGTFFSI